jgi:hypothetical protein
LIKLTQKTSSHLYNCKKYLVHIYAVIMYTSLALVVTWPIAIEFTTGIVGEDGGVDGFLHVWNMWWVEYALSHGYSPFYTHMLYYPQGVDLFWQTMGFSQGVAALPVVLLFGPIAGWNWTVISSFIIGGYVAFLFARHLTGNNFAALIAGTIYAFSPFHLEKLIDGNIVVATQWVPCFVFVFHLLLEHPLWWRVVLSGFLLLWVSLGSWYYGLFCVLYSVLATFVWMLYRERNRMLQLGLWGIAPVLLWGLVIAPHIITLAQAGDRVLSDMREIHISRSSDLMDFFLPNPVHPWWGNQIRDMRDSIYPNAILWNVSMGWIAWLLAGLGIVTSWRCSWRWTILLGMTLILAMGPMLQIAGYSTGIPLPFALLQDLPGIRASQRPNHMVVVSSLIIAVLAAYGVVWLMHRLPSRWSPFLSLMLIIAIIWVDGYAGSLNIVRRKIHPFYATLSQPDGALMPLPLYYNINRSENLTPQTVHEWPILGGYVARPPAYPFIAYTPGVRELVSGRTEPNDIVTPGWPESGRRALAAYDIQYVTMDLTSDKDKYFSQVRERMQDLGVGAPLVADTDLEVYELPQTWPVLPVGFLGPGWQPREYQNGTHWRWMGEQAEIWLFNPLDHSVVMKLSLTMASYHHTRTLHIALDDINIGQIAVAANQRVVQEVSLLLSPGEHRFTMQAESTPDPKRNDIPISVQFFQIEPHFNSANISVDSRERTVNDE